jgi:hypothetical protein
MFSIERDRTKTIVIVLSAAREILQLCVLQHLILLLCSCLSLASGTLNTRKSG